MSRTTMDQITRKQLDKALEQISPTNTLAAALLLALPLDAAPGIDLYYNESRVGFRGVTVPRTEDPVETALNLRSAYLETSHPPVVFRDLAADSAHWVGWYRSGTHLYSSGCWEFFGRPDLAVPADPPPPLFDLLTAALGTPVAPAGRPTPLHLPSPNVTYSIRFPSDPSANYAQVTSTSTLEAEGAADLADLLPSPLTSWDVLEDACSQVGEMLNPQSIISVPLLVSEDAAEADLVATLSNGAGVIIPISMNLKTHSTQLGVPVSRIDRSAQPKDAVLPGFEVVGEDNSEPGVVFRHIDSGLLVLLPRLP